MVIRVIIAKLYIALTRYLASFQALCIYLILIIQLFTFIKHCFIAEMLLARVLNSRVGS